MKWSNTEGRSRASSVPRIALWYITRGYLLSFAISFLFFFVIFFINQILLLAEDILSKNAPFYQTVLLLIYSLPSVVAIAFPFSALAGSLITSSGLNADREMLALSAAGISTRMIYLPFIVLGLLASIFSFAANDYFLPRGSAAFRALYGELVARSASIELTPYSVKKYSNAVIVTGAREGEDIGDIMLFDASDKEKDRLISADRATLSIDDQGEYALIEMNDVLEHSASKSDTSFSLTTADSLSYRFTLKEPIVGFSGTSPSEMSADALVRSIRKKQEALATRVRDLNLQVDESRSRVLATYGDEDTLQNERAQIDTLGRQVISLTQAQASKPSDRSLQIYELEYNKKFAIPAAGFFFSLLAFPLGLGARRAGRTAGFGIALLLSTMYWGLLFAGQTAGLRNMLSPGIAMWTPNFLVGIAAAVIWIVRLRGSSRSV